MSLHHQLHLLSAGLRRQRKDLTSMQDMHPVIVLNQALAPIHFLLCTMPSPMLDMLDLEPSPMVLSDLDSTICLQEDQCGLPAKVHRSGNSLCSIFLLPATTRIRTMRQD